MSGAWILLTQASQHLIQLLEQSQKQLATSIGMQPLDRQEATGGIAEAALNGTVQALADGVPHREGIALTQGDRCRLP